MPFYSQLSNERGEVQEDKKMEVVDAAAGENDDDGQKVCKVTTVIVVLCNNWIISRNFWNQK